MSADRGRVLVVDPDEVWRRSLLRGLPRHGFSVSAAATLGDGRVLCRLADVAALVVDVLLPDGHGLRLLPELRAVHPAAVAIVCTARGSIAAAVAAIRMGAHDFLLRPAPPEQIAAAIEQARDAQPGRPPPTGPAPPAAMSLDRIHWEHLQRVLVECDWNISEAARRLGIHRQSLQRKLKQVQPLRPADPRAPPLESIDANGAAARRE